MELLLMENPIPLFLARGKLTLGLYKCLTRLEMELAMEGGRASEWPLTYYLVSMESIRLPGSILWLGTKRRGHFTFLYRSVFFTMSASYPHATLVFPLSVFPSHPKPKALLSRVAPLG